MRRRSSTLSLLTATSISAALACAPAPNGSPDGGGEPATDGGVAPPPVDAGVEPGSDGGVAPPPGDGGSVGTDGGRPQPDAGTVTYANERCAQAEAVTPGTPIESSTAGAVDDHQGSCGGEGGPDLVYSVTLDEPSGMTVDVFGYDLELYVTQQGCDVGNEITGGCDEYDAYEEEYDHIFEKHLNFALLPAGQYYIVVDTYAYFFDEAGSDFTLNVQTYPGGYCFGDAYDPEDDAPASATSLGGDDIDSQDLTPGSVTPSAVELVLCAEDVDYYYLPHMGGTLEARVTGLMSVGQLQGELFEADTSGADLALGAKVADLPLDPPLALARGDYLLKVSGSGQSGLGDNYALRVAHECRSDMWDEADPEADDATLESVAFTLWQRPTAPIERRICGSDIDTVLLDNVYDGRIEARIIGGGDLSVELLEVVDQGMGDTGTQPYPGTVQRTTDGDDLVLTLSGVPGGTRVLLRVAMPDPTVFATRTYGIDAIFGEVPANATCGQAETLSPAAEAAPVIGSTLNSQSSVVGPCNGDRFAEEDGVAGAADVFYTFTIPQPLDTDILFNGALDVDRPELDFEGSVYLFEYPGVCPTSLADLLPVRISDEPEADELCGSGTEFRLRVPQLAAGAYLLVVDGTYDSASRPIRSSGRFEVTVRGHPDGFPPTQACIDAVDGAVPAPGQMLPEPILVDTRSGTSENDFEDYGCVASGGARGKEVVVRLTPSETVTVDIETVGVLDTVLILREGTCVATSVDTDIACDDDGGEGLASKITGAVLEAGNTYYLYVDGWAESTEGVTTVEIRARN